MHPFPTVSDTCDRHIAFPSKCVISPEDSAIGNNERECLVGIPTLCHGDTVGFDFCGFGPTSDALQKCICTEVIKNYSTPSANRTTGAGLVSGELANIAHHLTGEIINVRVLTNLAHCWRRKIWDLLEE